METTLSTHLLKIEGMSCGWCVKKVSGVLKEVPGIATHSVELGRARIACESARQCEDACEALTAEGYRTMEVPDVEGGVALQRSMAEDWPPGGESYDGGYAGW